MRDYQKSRLYAWEREIISPLDKSHLSFEQVKLMVAGIWLSEGFLYPPEVIPKAKQNTTAWAKANRVNIWVPLEGLPRWVVLHELAHSANSDLDSTGDRHGPNFVGIYMKFLVKYLNVPLPLLMFTAKKSNVDFNIGAQPSFKE